MTEDREKKKMPAIAVAFVAIALWILQVVFQSGGLFAYATIRDYVDKGDVQVMQNVDKKFDAIMAEIKDLRKEKADKGGGK